MLQGLKTINGEKIDFVQMTKECRLLELDLPYKEIGEDWQYEIDKAIANYQCVYLQLARGHDKTERFAWWSLLWLSSTYAGRGYCCGVDADNAALFRNASRKLKALHPDLFLDIEIQKKFVLNHHTGSCLETISSDVDSAYGLNFDLLIINDFHAWPDEDFWSVLWTACGKKPGIRIWIESNALTLGTEGAAWVSKQRKMIKEFSETLFAFNGGRSISKDDKFPEQYNDYLNKINRGYEWFFYAPKGFLASWQKHQLIKWEKSLHPSVYRRLINNEDTSGEESFVTIEQVEAITSPQPDKEDYSRSNNGKVITAVDLGLKKDATAISTVISYPSLVDTSQSPTEQKRAKRHNFRLLACDVFTGSIDDPVQLRYVENMILHHRAKYNSSIVLIDPWSAASLVQKYSFIQEWNFTVAHVRELTQSLYRAISDKTLTLYPKAGHTIQDGEDWDLQRELVSAVVKDCSYGQRVDHKAGGYSDRLMSLGMCIHYLSDPENFISSFSLPSQSVNKDKDEMSAKYLIGDWEKNFSASKSKIGMKI